MDSSSSFGNTPDLLSQAEPLETNGGTCDCYRVRLYGRLHFLKRLKEDLRTDPRYVAAMEKEFETGYGLDHPHIVRYLSKGDDYLLMEYVDGEDLSDFMKSHPDYFTAKAHADRFLMQLLDAVDCLHQHDIVHLDLKPQNILITRVGQNVKLADLGFCYTDAYPDTMGRTERYAAPEQFDNHQIPDARTDIYAIGRIIERFPCAGNYRNVIARCTASRPEQRYQSVQELLSALQPKPKRWRTIAATCLAIAILAAFVLLWQRSSAPMAESPTPQAAPSVEEKVEAQPVVEPQPQATAITPPAPAATQEKSPSPTPTKSMSVTELRQKLRSIAQPIYEATLGQLQDLPYQGNEQLFSQTGQAFDQQLRERFRPLCDQLEKSGAFSENTFCIEWDNLRLEYHNTTYDKMLRNEKAEEEE